MRLRPARARMQYTASSEQPFTDLFRVLLGRRTLAEQGLFLGRFLALRHEAGSGMLLALFTGGLWILSPALVARPDPVISSHRLTLLILLV